MGAIEELGDFVAGDLVEIVGDGDLTGEEAGTVNRGFGGGVDGGDFDHGLAGFGDDEWLPLERLFDKAGEVGFGFVDIDCTHRTKFY